jgi:hypothetical protein
MFKVRCSLFDVCFVEQPSRSAGRLLVLSVDGQAAHGEGAGLLDVTAPFHQVPAP